MINRLQLRNEAPEGHWRKKMACATEDSALFAGDTRTPAGRADIKKAKAICYGCAAVNNCAYNALKNEESTGVWGGMGPDQLSQALERGGRELVANMGGYPDPGVLNQVRHLGRAGIVPVKAPNYIPLRTRQPTAPVIPLQPTASQPQPLPVHAQPPQQRAMTA